MGLATIIAGDESMDRICKARLILSLDDSSFPLLIDTEGGGRPTVK
jgi:hypothetical protein